MFASDVGSVNLRSSVSSTGRRDGSGGSCFSNSVSRSSGKIVLVVVVEVVVMEHLIIFSNLANVYITSPWAALQKPGCIFGGSDCNPN